METDQARAIIRRSSRVTILTGSGMSSESGIPTFRDANGLWQSFDPADFANALGIVKHGIINPRRVAQFLHAFLAPIATAVPNAGHFAITEMQTRRAVSIITQNVDGLHQRSGSRNVFELHGSVYQSARLWKKKVVQIDMEELNSIVRRLAKLTRQSCNIFNIIGALDPMVQVGFRGMWLPNLVLFGQRLPIDVWEGACSEIERSDCLLVIGTSLTVFPAASLVGVARRRAKPIIRIDPHAGEENCVTGLASAILPEICT
jgi:NAD-dependent deacetylase